MKNLPYSKVNIKICGITNYEDAKVCIKNNVDALGFIFYPKSPRFITPEKASKIIKGIPQKIYTVGVFVDESFEKILKIAKITNIKVVQLHGNEDNNLVNHLKKNQLKVIKVLFGNKEPNFNKIKSYSPDAFLVECPSKNLPGGTGKAWNWKKARNLSPNLPLILAGGLNPQNIKKAIEEALPFGVDVSSGLEKEPGKKEHEKIIKFINIVKNFKPNTKEGF